MLSLKSSNVAQNRATNTDMGDRVVEWSGLPKELLEVIGKIDSHLDVL
jgi:hypothetical protein